MVYSILLLTVLAPLAAAVDRPLVQEPLTEIYKNFSQGIDIQDGTFDRMMDLAIWNDLSVCYNETLVLFWDGYESLHYFVDGDMRMGIQNMLLVVHESPVVYKECLILMADVSFIDEVFNIFEKIDSVAIWTHLGNNLLYNMADIIRTLMVGRTNLINKDLNAYGKSIGQIVSDVFFVNPVDEAVWTEEHSQIIIDETSSKKVPSRFYETVEV
mmetsp:Transcript_32265/g.49388  ORF Transcript_32265/g.49388 Transcript_32265/m.49388 type:complete len:213 (-) Transcript_32265:312-950(-)|eukprot:CAMPEP_0170491836 /NCGR_PEP_ID=MMETSP0208-20121228/11282_1 /TAXON_ID=197538 /ORGANISM="Strombidium inclinatum, Strain S3" /LENGTH=212 /DNA_ID=CAMNT_0010767477 /DNA_START=15 /DNA_END=653 /DNA_ORIENTATION=-